MKFILTSDWHLVHENPVCRKDNLFDTQFAKLGEMFNYAVNNKIKYILQAGDMFDKPRDWYVLDRLIRFLANCLEKGIQVFCVRGQHDMYFRNTKESVTNSTLLEQLGLITVLVGKENFATVVTDYKDRIRHDIHIYGASYGEDVPIPKTSGRENDINILVIHKEISNHLAYEMADFTKAKEFLDKHNKFDLILCGDIHQYFCETTMYKGRAICNTGPLLRKEATEDMIAHKPCFMVYDSIDRKITNIQLTVAPAKEVISDTHLEMKHMKEEVMEKFKDGLSSSFKGVSFTDILEKYLKDNNIDPIVCGIISAYMERSNQ